MRIRIRKGNRISLALAAVSLSLLLTGCLARSQGGKVTVRGYEQLEEGEFSDALSSFQSAIESGEDEVPAYRGEGIALMGLARYTEAAEAFETALSYTDSKMDQTRYDILKYQANSYIRSENYSDAITVCTTLLDMKADGDTYYNLGAAYLGLGDEEQAKTNFDRAVAMSPDDYALYLQIYQYYDKFDLTAEGDTYLKTAESIPPETDEDRYELGRIYYYLEQYDEANDVLAPAVANKYTPALELMGEVYLAQEDYDHALATFQSLMDIKGETPEAYNGLALCAIASGNYDGALTYIEEGLSLDGEEGRQDLLFDEIVCYEKKLDFETAYQKVLEYIEKYPTDEDGQKEYHFLNTRVNTDSSAEEDTASSEETQAQT